jgi:hypothetical protein
MTSLKDYFKLRHTSQTCKKSLIRKNGSFIISNYKVMKYFLLFILSISIVTSSILAQPTIQWSKCYGGTRNDFPSSLLSTRDGGYIMAGSTASTDKDIFLHHGDYDVWVVKLNSDGSIKWEKTFGGTGGDAAGGIIQAFDGSYLIAGSTNSNDGDVTGAHGGSDVWILKIDSLGNLLWEKTYGGSNNEAAATIMEAGEGGYAIFGTTNSTDGDVKGFHGGIGSDIWIFTITGTGTIIWQKTLGGSGDDQASSFIRTSDGGYALTGFTNSVDGDLLGRVRDTTTDLWALKLTGAGELLWQKTFGGSSYEQGNAIIETLDHGFGIIGSTLSNDGDVSGLHGFYSDAWLLKLGSTGTMQWQKTYGGTQGEIGFSIIQKQDSGYVVAASTVSEDGDVSGLHGSTDCWIFKTTKTGDLLWQKTLGGSKEDASLGAGIIPTPDSGFLVASMTKSSDGDVLARKGDSTKDWDIWLVKLSPEKAAVNNFSNDNEKLFSVYPNPSVGPVKFRYNLPTLSEISIEIFNPLGEKLRTLLNSKEEAGTHEQIFDITPYPAGMYFLKIDINGKYEMQKIEVIK